MEQTFTVDPGEEWPEWSQVWDPASASYYYYNNYTGDSSWEQPEGFTSPSGSNPTAGQGIIDLYPPFLKSVLRIQRVYRAKKDRHALRIKRATEQVVGSATEEEWIAVYDPQHKCDYYYNSTTEECVWEKPPQLYLSSSESIAASEEDVKVKSIPEGEDQDLDGKGDRGEEDAAKEELAEWAKVYDPSSESFYYFNNFTLESVWERPDGFVEESLKKAKHLMSPQLKAAIALQCAYRARRARREMRQQRGRIEVEQSSGEATAEWTKVLDPSSGSHYYYHAASGECTWDAPEGAAEDPQKTLAALEEAVDEPSDAGLGSSTKEDPINVKVAERGEEAPGKEESESVEPNVETTIVEENAFSAEKQKGREGGEDNADSAEQEGDKFEEVDLEWVQLYDSSSCAYYYYNQNTGESAWQAPETFTKFNRDKAFGAMQFAREIGAAVAVQNAWRVKLARRKVQSRQIQQFTDVSPTAATTEAHSSFEKEPNETGGSCGEAAEASLVNESDSCSLETMALKLQGFWRYVCAKREMETRRAYLEQGKTIWHSLLVQVITSTLPEDVQTATISCGSFDGLDYALAQQEWRPNQGYTSFGCSDRGVLYTDVLKIQVGATQFRTKLTNLFRDLAQGEVGIRSMDVLSDSQGRDTVTVTAKLCRGPEERQRWVKLDNYKLRELFFDRKTCTCSSTIPGKTSGVCVIQDVEVDRAIEEAIAAFEFNQLNKKEQALRRSRYREKVERQREGDAIMEAAKSKFAFLLKQVCSSELSFDVCMIRTLEVKSLRARGKTVEGWLLDFEWEAFDEVLALLDVETEAFHPECEGAKLQLVQIKPEKLEEVTELAARLVEQSTIIEAQLFVAVQEFLDRSRTSVVRDIEVLQEYSSRRENAPLPVRLQQRYSQVSEDQSVLIRDFGHLKRGPATAVSAAFQMSRYDRMVQDTRRHKDEHWMRYFDETHERVVFRKTGEDDYEQVAVWDKPPRIKAKDTEFVVTLEDGNGAIHAGSTITSNNSALKWFKCATLVIDKCITVHKSFAALVARIEALRAHQTAEREATQHLVEQTHRRVNELIDHNSMDSTVCRQAFLNRCRAAWEEGLRLRVNFDSKVPVTPKARGTLKKSRLQLPETPIKKSFSDPFDGMAFGCTLDEFKAALLDARRRREIQERRPFDINAADRTRGDILLHKACWYGRQDLIEYLLEEGADINVPLSSFDSGNCVHVAVSAGKTEIIRVLFERGASLCVQDANGDTPLHVACRLNCLGAVEEILHLIQSKDAEGMRLKFAKLVLCKNKRNRLASEVVLVAGNLHKSAWVQRKICSLLWCIEEKARDRLQFCVDESPLRSDRSEPLITPAYKTKKVLKKKRRKKRRLKQPMLQPLR